MVLETDDLRAAVPAFEAALEVYRKQGRDAVELASLVGPLATASYFVDFRLSHRYGVEALDSFQRATGLTRALELTPLLRQARALGVAIAGAAVERRLLRDRQRARRHARAVRAIFPVCGVLAGVGAVCNDVDAIRRVTGVLEEPFSALGDSQGAVWILRYCKSLMYFAEGRFPESRELLVRILAKLEEKGQTAFPESGRRLFLGGALSALGAIDGLRDGTDVLAYASRLDALDLRLYDVVSEQLRMLYHAHRGESELARRCQEKVEWRAAERGSTWQIDVWEPTAMLLIHVRESNVMGLKLMAERLARIAQEIPSLERYALIAKAAYPGCSR